MITFGAGKLIAVPTQDALGNAIAVPTPVAVAVLQDVSVDIDYETKMLHGERMFPVALGRGKAKIGWKAKSGDFKGALLGSLLLGASPSAVRKGAVIDEAKTIPAPSGPYTVTVTPPNSGTFVTDLGVTDVLTGLPLTRVASGPVTGQYSLSGAVYTFAAADASKAILISHEYTVASDATAQLFNIANISMGYAPTFAAIFYNQYNGKTLAMKLNANVLGKLALPFKNDDFTMNDIDADAFSDASNNVGYICMY